MNAAAIIGIDLAKRSFQLHGTDANGAALFRRKISRERLLEFLAGQPTCVVAMEACASAHHWGRAISELGHEVRLLPPVYVKPYVKRQKNDAADAEAIAEAASRPSMRFVALKTPAQQARAMVFRTRDMLVRQRTQSVNALRGHLAEHGIVAPRGLTHVGRLAAAVEDPSAGLPDGVRRLGRLLLEQIAWLDERIADLAKELRLAAAEDPEVRRLMTMPGIGPVAAMAIAAFAPPLESFASGRHFAAWLGIVPRQHSTGGKSRLGRTSRMGQRDIRRLLIIGATTVVRWASRNGAPAGTWLARMLARKPKMLVATALANKMARMIWAMGTKSEVYRDPAPMAA
jgi:transposase